MEPTFYNWNFIRKIEIIPEQIDLQINAPISATCLPLGRAL
jgi:hypothetical protein